MRRLAERALRDLRFVRRLPAAFDGVPIEVTPSAGLRYLLRPMARVDPVLLALAAEQVGAGARVWDIGANVGLFTFAAAARAGGAGQVLAVEPDVWLMDLLERSRRLQPPTSASVALCGCAVADATGRGVLHIANRSRAANALAGFGSTQMGGVREAVEVPVTTLDALAAEHGDPDLVKIDVEGAELSVLHGGARLLQRRRPVVIGEVSADNAQATAALFDALGYTMLDGERPPSEREPLRLPTWTTLFLPRG